MRWGISEAIQMTYRIWTMQPTRSDQIGNVCCHCHHIARLQQNIRDFGAKTQEDFRAVAAVFADDPNVHQMSDTEREVQG